MAIKITGKFEPNNVNTDIYPITDSQFNLGGHHEVDTFAERDNISELRRRVGMTCYVGESGLTYQLVSGITNANWVIFGANVVSNVNNGLSLSGDTIQLGGDIIKNTLIGTTDSATTYNLSLQMGDSNFIIENDSFVAKHYNRIKDEYYMIYLTDDGGKFSCFYNGGEITDFNVNKNEIKITSESSEFSGISYDKDYSKNYTLRTLPDVEFINKFLKYTLQQTDSQLMWGGESQIWTDGDDNPIIFENKGQDEHIVDLYNRDIEIEEKIIDIGRYIELTYDELVILKDNAELIPGKRYKIMDFQTIHDIPYTMPWEQHIGSIEEIIVVANTIDTLSPTVYSELFPDDEIIYDIDKNTTDKTGTSRPGWIVYRKERIKQVETSFDFREVTIKRWRITSNTTYNSGTTYHYQSWVKDASGNRLYRSLIDGNIGNDLLDDDYWLEIENNFSYHKGTPWTAAERLGNMYESYFTTSSSMLDLSVNITECSNLKMTHTTLEIPNNYLSNISTNTEIIECFNNTFFNGVRNVGTLYDVHDNYFTGLFNSKVGTNVKYNILKSMVGSEIGADSIGNSVNYFYFSKIGKQMYHNVIAGISYTTIGELAQHNVITGQFDKNVIGGNFQHNRGNFFSTNTIGEAFKHNTTKKLINNTFGNFCQNNDLYLFGNNIIGSTFSYNVSIDDSKGRNNNRIGDNFRNNTITGYLNYNIINNNCDGNRFNGWFENNNITGTFIDNENASTFRYNQIGKYCQHNNFSGITNNNIFGAYQNNNALGNFSNNSMGNADVSGNVFGQSFDKNTISLSLFNSTFGEFARSNFFNGETNQNIICGDNFQKNRFDDRIIGITTLDNFRYNYFSCEVNSVDYSLSTHVYTVSGIFLTKNIIRTQSATTPIILTYYDSTNTLVAVDHTT